MHVRLKSRPMSIHHHRLKDSGVRQISLGNQTVYYTLKRSPRARHVRFEVRPSTGLTVVVPRSYNLSNLQEVLNRRSTWILGKLAETARTVNTAAPTRLETGDTIPYLGRELTLVVEETKGPRGEVELRNDTLKVQLQDPNLDVALLLEKWYRKEAARVLGQRVGELAQDIGVEPRRITVRGQKTLWASCSSSGALSLNWRLMLTPQRIVDYVLIHELTHLRELNHSRRFWHMVAAQCPQWQEHRKWLNDHEREIHAVLPS